jgi:transcriptional regulator with XRE-family HTH domain
MKREPRRMPSKIAEGRDTLHRSRVNALVRKDDEVATGRNGLTSAFGATHPQVSFEIRSRVFTRTRRQARRRAALSTVAANLGRKLGVVVHAARTAYARRRKAWGVFYFGFTLMPVRAKGTVLPTEPQSTDRAANQSPDGPDPRIGARIALARREAELTQRALADRIGVRLWMVDQWESCARAVPPEQLEHIADATKRPARWFLTGTDDALTELRAKAPQARAFDAELEAEELERLARGVGEREQALAEREVELQELGERLQEARRQADARLADAERKLLELERRRQELANREQSLEDAERERSQTDEAAVVGKALISAQRAADLLQAEAAQETETILAAARIEAKAIEARAQRAGELADRDRADADELVTQLREALGDTIARWNSLVPHALDIDAQEREERKAAAGGPEQVDGSADGDKADPEQEFRSVQVAVDHAEKRSWRPTRRGA